MSSQSESNPAKAQGERLRQLMRDHNPALKNVDLKRRMNRLLTEDGVDKTDFSDSQIGRWTNGRNLVTNPKYRDFIARALGVEQSSIWPEPPAEEEDGKAEATPFQFHEFDFRVEEVNFYRITHWNSTRQLRTENVAEPTIAQTINPQNWVDDDLWRSYTAAVRGGSPCASIRNWLIDDRESRASNQLRLEVAESHYRNFTANHRLFEEHPELLEEVKQTIADKGLLKVLDTAPLSNVTMNTTILSSDGYVLMMKRSEAANTYPGEWAAGPHETMNWPQEDSYAPSGTTGAGGRVETVFELAERAIREEAHLFSDDYPRIFFSWFGIWLQDVSYYFFAHVKSRLTRDEISERAPDAESAYETPEFDWLAFTHETVQRIVNTRKGAAGPRLGAEDEPRYLATSLVALTQLWRVRELLDI